MTADHVLAIDQGTTSTRAILFDRQARVVSEARRELTQHYPQPGWIEHDPEEIWGTVASVVPRALAQAGIEASRISAIGLPNQRETIVLWERRSGRPVAPAENFTVLGTTGPLSDGELDRAARWGEHLTTLAGDPAVR